MFAPAALPYVVRALPLGRPGYQAVVPLFSIKDRFQETRLTVVGPEDVVLEDGTTVAAVAVDQGGGGGVTRGFAQRHFVDPATREIVRTTLTPPGMSLVIGPVSAEVAATVWPVRALPATPPVALVPGHPDLALEAVALEDGASEMRYTVPEPRSLWHIEEAVTREGDVVTVAMSAASASDPSVTVRDTVRVRWPTLEPLSHHRVSTGPDGGSAQSLRFDGGAVTGSTRSGDGEPQPLDLELREPVFGPRSVALVARALPLRAGYSATVPTFTAAERLGSTTLTVVGRQDVETAEGTVSAWVVEEVHDGPTRRYAVHPETRALLATTYSPSPGSMIETVRL